MIKFFQKINSKLSITLYLIFAGLSGILGTLFSLIIRMELAAPGGQLLMHNYQLYKKKNLRPDLHGLPLAIAFGGILPSNGDNSNLMVLAVAVTVLFLFLKATATESSSEHATNGIGDNTSMPLIDIANQEFVPQTGAWLVDIVFLLCLPLLWYNLPFLDYLWYNWLLIPYGPLNSAIFWSGFPGSSLNWAAMTAQWGSFFAVLFTAETSPLIVAALKTETPVSTLLQLFQTKLGLVGPLVSPTEPGKPSIVRTVVPIIKQNFSPLVIYFPFSIFPSRLCLIKLGKGIYHYLVK